MSRTSSFKPYKVNTLQDAGIVGTEVESDIDHHEVCDGYLREVHRLSHLTLGKQLSPCPTLIAELGRQDVVEVQL